MPAYRQTVRKAPIGWWLCYLPCCSRLVCIHQEHHWALCQPVSGQSDSTHTYAAPQWLNYVWLAAMALFPAVQHEEQREKLRIVRTVLEQGGTFSGINRKVQLKPTKWGKKPMQPDPAAAAAGESGQEGSSSQGQQSGEKQQQQQQQRPQAPHALSVSSKRISSTGGGSSGGAEVAEKDKDKDDDQPVVSELLLILKYGGVLTHAGRAQAEELGKMFRMVMYPR